MRATWVDDEATIDSQNRSVSYRHPKGRTISKLEILSVCATHDFLRTAPVEKNPYGGSPGYVDVPENPTEAEKVYIGLFRYGGQNFQPDTCDCVLHMVTDRLDPNSVTLMEHAEHTRRCEFHVDDVSHERALGENKLKSDAVNTIRAARPDLIGGDDILWSFDSKRALILDLPKLDDSEKAAVASLLSAEVAILPEDKQAEPIKGSKGFKG